MISEDNQSIVEKAKRIYAGRLQSELEAKHFDKFVAIEPESGEHFIADSFSQAVAIARRAYPDQIAFVIRIGHAAALHIGGISN